MITIYYLEKALNGERKTLGTPRYGIFLVALGVGLILYGNTLPKDFVVHGIWIFSYQANYNILMLIGLFLIPVGLSFLLFWFFTRLKKGAK